MKFKLKNPFFISGIVYLLFIFFLQLANGWYQNFSDAVHYLWIADKYAEGDWQNAVNTYWGPMISWLLLILKPLIDEPFVRFRVLQIVLGLAAVWIIHKIFQKKEISTLYSTIFLCSITPFIASFAWFYLTPDLLLLDGILLTLLFFENENELNFKSALLAALLGALLFFIKSAGLYFFLILVGGRYLFTTKLLNSKSFFHHVQIAFFLAIFCSIWIIPISLKNGSFTMGTSSAHNFKMNSPLITPDIYGEVGNPYHLGTLTKPVPANAFDACVEHAHQYYASWEGWTKNEIARYYLKIITKNLKSARSMFFGIDTGTVFILLLITAFIYNRKKTLTFLKHEKNYLLIFVANIILYLPFFFMDRYNWPGQFAIILLLVSLLFSNIIPPKKIIVFSVALVLFSLGLFLIYKEYKYTLSEKPVTKEIWNSKRQLQIGRTIWICSKDDKRLGLVKGMIYYNSGQYLGALFSGKSKPETIEDEIKKFDINTIIFLDTPSAAGYIDTASYQVLLKSPAVSLYRKKAK